MPHRNLMREPGDKSGKVSQKSVNYRRGTQDEHCGICSMFRKPRSCTHVAGIIYPEDTCDDWEAMKA